MPQKTTLSEIREFLEAEGCAPAPWSTPEAALQRLYDLLTERRDDERFWARLKDLVGRLDEARFDARALPEFDTLGHAAVDRLVDDLRGSLGDTGDGSRPLRRWMSTTAGIGIVAFLLFGIAVSCDDGDGDDGPDWTVETWSCEDQADEHNIVNHIDVENLCSLGDYVKSSGVYDSEKELMLECLPDFDAARRVELLDQFQNATAEELNDVLNDMTREYEECGPERTYNYSGSGCH